MFNNNHTVKTGNKNITVHGDVFNLYWNIVEIPEGFYYCAYVHIPLSMSKQLLDKIKDKILNFEIDVHGGVTWNEYFKIDEEYIATINDKQYVGFGWDYIHPNDCSVFNPEGEVHTLEDVQSECENTIFQIETILNN